MRWVENTKRIGAPLLCAKQSILQSSPACPSCQRLLSVSSPARRDARVFKDKDGKPLPSKPIIVRRPVKERQPRLPASLFKKLFLDDPNGTPADTEKPVGNDPSIRLKPIRQHKERPAPGGPADLKRASDRGQLWNEKRKERVSTDALRAWLESQVEEEENSAARAHLDKLPIVDEKTPVVLIMFNASKSLTESDFHRLVRQNPHLEGWNTQLEKVAQAYDRNTLEPFGCYFLHFNSATAARKFQLEAQALHSTPPTDNLNPYTTPSLRLSASPETPLRLKMYALQPHTLARLRAFTLEGIIGAPKSPIGGAGKKASQKTPSQASARPHRVVLSLQQGAVESATLQDLLRRDGVSRNLAWDVTEILPYHAGKAIMSSRMIKGLAWKSRTALKAGSDGSEASELPEAFKTSDYSKSGRFVLSFGGEAEARRFTRMWHRRELQLPQDARAETEAEDGTSATITVNAMIPL
ncbi:hypothetical protein F5X68DRAFT_8079 [Plectosphaerella plurivora]|uniref:Uncharacterized protein n=1 Tax=Plectosphaerella plurivora TaxID=936078 RepID=A0A9P9ACF4_9PEZI|nr:hypothetical protein F5X68DRAFT_8079 [Plectosphaerella plurivora]